MSSGHRGQEKRERKLPVYRIEVDELLPRGLEGDHEFSGKDTCDHCGETRAAIFYAWIGTLKPGTRLDVPDPASRDGRRLLRVNPKQLKVVEPEKIIDPEPPRAA